MEYHSIAQHFWRLITNSLVLSRLTNQIKLLLYYYSLLYRDGDWDHCHRPYGSQRS